MKKPRKKPMDHEREEFIDHLAFISESRDHAAYCLDDLRKQARKGELPERGWLAPSAVVIDGGVVDTLIDYKYWASLDGWTLRQAIDLITDYYLPPDLPSIYDRLPLDEMPYGLLLAERVRQLLLSALHTNGLSSSKDRNGVVYVRPAQFIWWAIKKELPVPQELMALADDYKPGESGTAARAKPHGNTLHGEANRKRVLEEAKKVLADRPAEARFPAQMPKRGGRPNARAIAEILINESERYFGKATPPLKDERMIRDVLRPAIRKGTLK